MHNTKPSMKGWTNAQNQLEVSGDPRQLYLFMTELIIVLLFLSRVISIDFDIFQPKKKWKKIHNEMCQLH